MCNRGDYDAYFPSLAPTPPAVGALPDATLRWPRMFLDEIPASYLWEISEYGLVEGEHVPSDEPAIWCFGPFYRVQAQWDPLGNGEVRLWFGPDRRACTEALSPSIELLDAWRRERCVSTPGIVRCRGSEA